VAPVDLDIVRQFFAELRSSNWDPALERQAIERFFHPDAEWHTMRELPGGGIRRGREAVQKELRDQRSAFGEFEAELEDLQTIGDQAVGRLVLRSRPRGASVPIETRVGNICTFREGKIYRVRAFKDPEEAVAVAEAEAKG
jgi:ketosteroid isomerase-like protein